MRAAVKFGLNPLDRPRVEIEDADSGPDPFDTFLDNPSDAYEDLYEKENQVSPVCPAPSTP
jgi:hypothetical protein